MRFVLGFFKRPNTMKKSKAGHSARMDSGQRRIVEKPLRNEDKVT